MRGIRNNNPLNIRRNKTKWEGLNEIQTDKDFFQFKEMKYGYRAAIITLRTYQKKYKLTTIRQMIGRWAPPNENNTEAYIKIVHQRSGLFVDVPIDLDNETQVVKLLSAMCFVENGVEANTQAIKDGLKLSNVDRNV